MLPLLTDDDVLLARERGTLPSRWRMRWHAESVVLLRPHGVVEVERCAPVPGAVMCLAFAGRLVWRRVLEVRNSRALLRADVAPFADGWFSDVFARAQFGRLESLPELAPKLWTKSAWWAAHRWAHVDLRRSRPTGVDAASVRWTVRKLSGLEDLVRLRGLLSRSYDHPFDTNFGAGQPILGLLANGRELVGFLALLVAGDSGYVAHMLVDPKFRGLGGGRQLACAAVEEAKHRKLETLYAHVHVLNVPSIRAFESAGFAFSRWWSDPADPFVAMERQWHVLERRL